MSRGWYCDKCGDTDGECYCCTCCPTPICKNIFRQDCTMPILINKKTAMMVCRCAENNDFIMAQINKVVPSKGYLDFIVDDRTPLTEACFYGNYDFAEFLILRGADVNFKDNYDDTPLHRACQNCHLEIVKLLLKENAEKNVVNCNAYTPEELASECNDVDKKEARAAIIELLKD